MLKNQVYVGKVYRVRLHGTFTNVQLLREVPQGGWVAMNQTTNREVRIKSAAKLRFEVSRDSIHHYEVMVGNIGSVYSGMNKQAAETKYDSYTKLSAAGYGIAGNENVSLLCDGDLVVEYQGNQGKGNADEAQS